MDVIPVDEGRRQAYLAALGIPLWSTRIDLPGALPSAPLDFVPFVVDAGPGVALVSPVSQAAVPAAGDVAVPRVADAAPVPARGGTTPAHPEAPVAPRVQEAAPPPSTPRVAPAQDVRLPRLACRVWALAPGLCAVVALEDAPDLAAAEHRLLAGIAQALDAPEPPQALGNVLRWPLNRNPALDHGPEAMHAWLSHALRLPPGRCVAFGLALAEHLRSAVPGLDLVAAPALAELLTDAAGKRQLWRNLNG